MTRQDNRHLPQRCAIDAYGKGGFRFGDYSHQGSLLILPSGMRHWAPQNMAELQITDFATVFAEAPQIEFFLLGTGKTMQRPSAIIRSEFASHNLRFDFMDTGAAIAIYNTVVDEGRAVAAGFLAVSDG